MSSYSSQQLDKGDEPEERKSIITHNTYIENLLGVLGLYVDAAPVVQQPDEHEHGGGQEQHVRDHAHARRQDGVVVAPDDPVRHGCRLLPRSRALRRGQEEDTIDRSSRLQLASSSDERSGGRGCWG